MIFERATDKEKELSKIKFGSKVKISRADKDALSANTLCNDTVIASYLKTNIEFETLKSVRSWFNLELTIDPHKFFIPYRMLFQLFQSKLFANSNLDPSILSDEKLMGIFEEFLTLDFISENIFNGKIPKNKLVNLLKIADFSLTDVDIVQKSKKMQETENDIFFEDQNMTQDIDLQDQTDIGFNLTPFKTILHHSYKENFSLPFDDESSGIKRYYVLMNILLKALSESKNESKIFVIDEIDRSLHPDLIEHSILTFLKMSRKHNFQLIGTTHNRELLMNKDLIRKDIIWFTEKKTDGSTDLFSLSDFKEIRKKNSYYNFYKTGKLGAVPNLIDFLDEDDTK
ncbi:AAA family ATPase [Thermodesulfobium sp. 4217-1]|uniref:AAA family ATPase n=1 Tax=Thermodesulfobium sp. 4217-1 TaxID=3120013 RepID=UPI003221E819